MSELDDTAVSTVQEVFRRKLGPNFKIDATPVNTIWGAFAVQDIDESPTVETLDIEGPPVQIRALSAETLYLIKVAADRKDRDDIIPNRRQVGEAFFKPLLIRLFKCIPCTLVGDPADRTESEGGNIPLERHPEPLPRRPVRTAGTGWSIMSYILSLVVAATVLGATQASSEDVGLGVSVRWVDNGVTVGTSLDGCYETDWNTAAIKEGDSELTAMIAIIERNREDRERKVVIDR